MLNDFSWNMTGYIPKHAVNPSDDGIPPYVAERIFQLEPEPPTVDNPNEYILSALREKDLKYFSFFLHHIKEQSLIQKQPSKSEGCFCIYARKA